MAYMNQEKKAKLAPAIKAALKKYGLKGSISVNNHSTLVLKIKSGKIDFIKNYNDTMNAKSYKDGSRVAEGYLQINKYWFNDHFTGKAKDCLAEIIEAMHVGNHDNSDPMTDYFDVGWYVDINVGEWNKPYTVEA